MITLADLRALQPLREYTDAELEMLLGAATERALRPGQVVCRQGDLGRSCYLLVQGSLEVRRESGLGNQVVSTMRPGSLVGQIALVDRWPRGATVRALQDGVMLELTRDVFERLLAACSPLALRFQHQLAITGIRHYRDALRRLAAAPREAPNLDERPSRDSLVGVLSVVQASSTEWGLSVEELDAVEFVAQELPRGPKR
ncbi:MAG: cyclic nucleotide-binding domain-containing protein [Deltaproteobacteria bacterium]|nr:cyclic nucleotide-binding domain-containing protein [Deltaproteobacteria bacterium]